MMRCEEQRPSSCWLHAPERTCTDRIATPAQDEEQLLRPSEGESVQSACDGIGNGSAVGNAHAAAPAASTGEVPRLAAPLERTAAGRGAHDMPRSHPRRRAPRERARAGPAAHRDASGPAEADGRLTIACQRHRWGQRTSCREARAIPGQTRPPRVQKGDQVRVAEAERRQTCQDQGTVCVAPGARRR